MERGDRESPPPFWSRTLSPSSKSNSNSSSSIISFVLILALSIFFILYFTSFLFSFSSSKLFRPSFAKNGWDLLSCVLVVFAILCGVLDRKNNAAANAKQDSQVSSSTYHAPIPAHSNNADWASAATASGPIRRMRRSSSYPDFRREAWWGPADSWRFADDIQLYRNNHQPRRSDHHRWGYHQHQQQQQNIANNNDNEFIKTIPVDTVEVKMSPPPKSRSPPPPPPPPPPTPSHPPRRGHVKMIPPAAATAAENRSAPPPLPPRPSMSETKIPRKKSSGAKDFAAAISHFYQKKRKRSSGSKIKKIHRDDTIADDAPVPKSPPSTPPPSPPPSPPRPSLFHNLFFYKKSGTSKKNNSSSPPSPPPLPLSKSLNYSDKVMHEHKTSSSASSSTRYSNHRLLNWPLSNSIYYYSVPPPPPPPQPVAIISNVRSGGDGDEGKEGEQQQIFCPSPDVNNKAEMFIARFRAGLMLEKLNSIREKQQTTTRATTD